MPEENPDNRELLPVGIEKLDLFMTHEQTRIWYERFAEEIKPELDRQAHARAMSEYRSRFRLVN